MHAGPPLLIRRDPQSLSPQHGVGVHRLLRVGVAVLRLDDGDKSLLERGGLLVDACEPASAVRGDHLPPPTATGPCTEPVPVVDGRLEEVSPGAHEGHEGLSVDRVGGLKGQSVHLGRVVLLAVVEHPVHGLDVRSFESKTAIHVEDLPDVSRKERVAHRAEAPDADRELDEAPLLQTELSGGLEDTLSEPSSAAAEEVQALLPGHFPCGLSVDAGEDCEESLRLRPVETQLEQQPTALGPHPLREEDRRSLAADVPPHPQGHAHGRGSS